MAVAIIVEAAGMSASQYDAAIKDAFPNGQTPAAMQLHVSGPIDGGWRAVDVWDSQEAFDAYARGPLASAFEKNGIKVEPKITVWPVHNMVTGARP
ncbi:MAG: hypothetical protein HW416_1733 [Chloroflexi bacterium]|nr:hypothetical protein [Chloroflexota bacterium]